MERFKKEYKKYFLYKELLTGVMAGEIAFLLFEILCITFISKFNISYKICVFAFLYPISWIIFKIILKNVLHTESDIEGKDLDEETKFVLADTIYKTQTIFKYGIVIVIPILIIPFPIITQNTTDAGMLKMFSIVYITLVFIATMCLITFNEIVAKLLEILSRDD